MYIDINILQSVPSSNINRDDTGAPKTAVYGGATRGRVSSQSWKRATRLAFERGGFENAMRTRMIPQLLLDRVNGKDAKDAKAKVEAAMNVFTKVENGQTKELVFITPRQLDDLADYLNGISDIKAATKSTAPKGSPKPKDVFDEDVVRILGGNSTLDMALFGRMVANQTVLNVEAASQVAHAISTHAVESELDYFTAVDDKNANGAGFITSQGFNSATLYRYANIDFEQLKANLGGSGEDAVKGAIEFIKDFALSMPTGKQNSYANKTLPSYIMVTLRPDMPVNLVGAFEKPVESEEGYDEASIAPLEDEFENTLALTAKPLATFVWTKHDTALIDATQEDSLKELLDDVKDELDHVTA